MAQPTSISHLDVALNEANKKGSLVVDMKRDWKLVLPAARSAQLLPQAARKNDKESG